MSGVHRLQEGKVGNTAILGVVRIVRVADLLALHLFALKH
jgi:hypothetical protein